MKSITRVATIIILAFLVTESAGQELGSFSIRYAHDSAARLTQFIISETVTLLYDYDSGGSIINRATTGSNLNVNNEIDESLPRVAALRSAYPNPFNPSTSIGYDLPSRQSVRIEVYDVLGRSVAVLIDGEEVAGRHHVRWDARGLGSGIYYVNMITGYGKEFIRSIVLLR